MSASATGPNLRSLLLAGDYFLGGVISGTLVKLLLRLSALKEVPGTKGRFHAVCEERSCRL